MHRHNCPSNGITNVRFGLACLKTSLAAALLTVCPISLSAQPLQHRLLIATSPDGLNFTRQRIILYNFGDVPDAVLTPSGQVFVYFQGILEPVHDVILVGTSANGVTQWSFQRVRIIGTESWPVRPCDPDVVYRNGTFRLYFTGDPLNSGTPETYSAVSTDGINFTLESGVRFSGVDRPVLDPSLLWVGDTLHYFAGGASPTQNWHAVSTDGIQFSRVSDFSVNGLMMSNGIRVRNGYRFYGFPNRPPPDMNIQSIFSTNGSTWFLDPGIRLERDPYDTLEAMYVKDPAIVIKDSVFLVYYVTRKPEYSEVSPYPQELVRQLQLFQNYPNPFNPSTTISYKLPTQSHVALKVIDMLGREVATMVNEVKQPGSYEEMWDASGQTSGVYFYQLSAESSVGVKKLILLK